MSASLAVCNTLLPTISACHAENQGREDAAHSVQLYIVSKPVACTRGLSLGDIYSSLLKGSFTPGRSNHLWAVACHLLKDTLTRHKPDFCFHRKEICEAWEVSAWAVYTTTMNSIVLKSKFYFVFLRRLWKHFKNWSAGWTPVFPAYCNNSSVLWGPKTYTLEPTFQRKQKNQTILENSWSLWSHHWKEKKENTAPARSN